MVCSANVLIQLNFFLKQLLNTSPKISHIGFGNKIPSNFFVFVALRPKSTAMVIAGRSVHLTTLFPGQA